VPSSETILELVEIELSRVRKLAEPACDGVLLYLIDMAILEAKRASSVANEESTNSCGSSARKGLSRTRAEQK
jgi:hypothetical protein